MTTTKKPIIRVEYDWTPENVALLGKMSDGDVAARIGGKADAVRHKRKTLKIKPFKSKHGLTKGKPRINFNWTEEALNLLGTKTDKEIALLLGLSSSGVARKRRLLGIAGKGQFLDPVVIPLSLVRRLGKWTDAKIAKEMGVSASVIARCRQRRNIAATILFNKLPPESLPLIGTMRDSDLARMFNVARTTVYTHRLKLGIKLFTPSVEIHV